MANMFTITRVERGGGHVDNEMQTGLCEGGIEGGRNTE